MKEAEGAKKKVVPGRTRRPVGEKKGGSGNQRNDKNSKKGKEKERGMGGKR